ncbi:MAG: CHASE2 domain-containing protein [Bacteroidota bacterium]
MASFKKTALPILIKIALGLGIGGVVVLMSIWDPDFIRRVDYLTTDYRFQNRYDRIDTLDAYKADFQQRSNVIIVGISEEDLKAMPDAFPFPRSYYAHLVENLNRAGAKVIALDLTFENVGREDSLFDAILQTYDNVILAVKIESDIGAGRFYLRSTERTYSNVFYKPGRRVGIVSVAGKDNDEVARRYFPLMAVGDYATPTFAFAALNVGFGLPDTATADIREESFVIGDRIIPKFDEYSFLLNYYGPDKTFRYVSFTQAIDDSLFQTKDEKEMEEEINLFDEGTMGLFKDKIVLVGSTMPEERDFHNTPLYDPFKPGEITTMNGVEIHATAIQNILDQAYIVRADRNVEIALIVLLALVSFFIILPIRKIKFRYVLLLELTALVVVVLFLFGIFEVALLSFQNSNLLINIINPSLAVVLAYIGAAVYQYLGERQQKALIKNVFSHYISSAVVNELVANPEKAKLGGDRRELTVFFSDIAGFTSISEQFHTKPEGLVELLNEYLDEMTAIILKHEGTLDKYEGDAIMAFWGAPIPQKDHALRTCLASLDMQKRLTQLRPKWKKEGKPALEVRCGINTGVMIVGNMGGKDRFDYTVIGDSVNLASRLEGANKQYGSNTMISDFTYQHVKDNVIVRELDLIQVKGKTEPVKVWELLGTADLHMTDGRRQSLELYHEGLKLYRARSWEEAIAYFQQAKQLDPTCRVAEIYEQRASLYQLNPPPANWNGVFVMTTK